MHDGGCVALMELAGRVPYDYITTVPICTLQDKGMKRKNQEARCPYEIIVTCLD